MSSGESEAVGVVKGACEGVSLQRLSEEWGDSRSIVLYSDATVALGFIGKDGLGRARHIDCGVLWLQRKTKRRT